MPAIRALLTPSYNSLAAWKTWGQWVNTALSLCGWSQSSDTGQINWPAMSIVTSGYEIWTMTDSLQTFCPVYLKLTYWTYSTSISLSFQVGTGSDGVGTLLSCGPVSQCTSVTSSTAFPMPCYAAGSTNRFHLMLFNSAAPGGTILFSIERSHDGAGADTADYVTYLVQTGSTFVPPSMPLPYCFQQTILLASAGFVPLFEPYGFTTQNIRRTTSLVRNQLTACPFWPMAGTLGHPMAGALCIQKADFLADTPFSYPVYGVAHTYIAQGAISNWGGQKGSTSLTAAIRFD